MAHLMVSQKKIVVDGKDLTDMCREVKYIVRHGSIDLIELTIEGTVTVATEDNTTEITVEKI